MKRSFIFCWMLVLIGIIGKAQSNALNFNQAITVESPQRYGNGNLVYLVRGDNLMTQGQFEQAIISYDNAVASDPFFAEAYIKRGVAKYRIGRVKEAEHDFKLANSLNPYADDLYGSQFGSNKLRVIAFEPYKWTTELSLEDRLHYYEIYYTDQEVTRNIQKSITPLKAGNYNEVLDILYNEAENNQPSAAAAYDMIGLIYSLQNQPERAIDFYQTSIEFDDNFALAHYNLGVARKKEGNYANALYHINRCIELAPQLYKAHFQRAILYKMLGRYEQALADYKVLKEKSSGKEEKIKLNQAITKKMSGDAAGALQDINRLLEDSENDDPLLFKFRGNAHLLLGKYYDAINDYSKAIQLDDNFAEAYFNRGLARILIYNRPDGCADLEKGVALGYEEGAERFNFFCGF